MEEIRNKIAESGIISLDLARFKPDANSMIPFDIAPLLWQGLVLKEKDFRQYIKEHDWKQYANKSVYVYCSVDAIVPTWAYMLLASCFQLAGVHFVIGEQQDLEKELIRKAIDAIDTNEYTDARLIIKGCSDVSCPEYAMSELIRKLQPVAKSIMYGEPCSTVPVFKRK